MLEHAGQGDMHDRHNIEEETPEFRTREILPQRQGGEHWAEDESGQNNDDGEGRDDAQHAKRQELMQPGSLEACRNEEPRQRKEHRQNGRG